MENLNIIIDTDPGTDDALALGLASVLFKDNIRALISTYGNADGEQTYTNMVNIASILNIHCDFIKGSLNPLEKTGFIPTNFHGKNGLCGLILPSANIKLSEGDFVRNIYDIIKRYKYVRYIALGPLTNFAELIDRFPDSAHYINELIIMGGGFDVSNMPNKTEFNFCADADAVKKVLECPVNKTIAPLDMTHKIAFSLEEIKDITGAKLESVFSELLYLNYYTSVKHGNIGAIIHDATTLAYLYDKNKCSTRKCKIISNKYGAIFKNASGHNTEVIESIDKEFMKSLFKLTFLFTEKEK